VIEDAVVEDIGTTSVIISMTWWSRTSAPPA